MPCRCAWWAKRSAGLPTRRGESAGCIRVLPDDAVAVWDWLAIGDTVIVAN